MPFVQGHLRDEPLLFEIETVCGHCGRAMQFEFDTDLNYRVKTPGAQPMVFEPKVDWATFTEPNIIHAY